MNGIPVISIAQADINYPVIIATLENLHKPIANKLYTHGITKYYAISEKMFQEMRKQTVPTCRRATERKLRLNELRRLSSDSVMDGIMISDEMLPVFITEGFYRTAKEAERIGRKNGTISGD